GLLERDTERLGDHAANRVAAAAGAKRVNEGDRLARIVIGAQRRAEQCRPCGHENETKLFHAWFLSGYREFHLLTRPSRAGAPYKSVRWHIAAPGARCAPLGPAEGTSISVTFPPSARCRAPWPRRRCAPVGARYRPRSQQARRNWGSAR